MARKMSLLVWRSADEQKKLPNVATWFRAVLSRPVLDLSFIIEIFMNFAAKILEGVRERDVVLVVWSKYEVSLCSL